MHTTLFFTTTIYLLLGTSTQMPPCLGIRNAKWLVPSAPVMPLRKSVLEQGKRHLRQSSKTGAPEEEECRGR